MLIIIIIRERRPFFHLIILYVSESLYSNHSFTLYSTALKQGGHKRLVIGQLEPLKPLNFVERLYKAH